MPNPFDLQPAAARALLAGGVPVFLSFDPVEYHGPHLSLRNDAQVCAGVVADLHRRLAPGEPLLHAAWDLGADPVPGPGSQPTPYPELRRRVLAVCRAVADLGARRVVLMTFHGAPLHNLALQAGVEALRRAGVAALAPMNLLLHQLVVPDAARFEPVLETIADPAGRARVRAGLGVDFHAGFGETSIALHYAPETVSPRYREVPPCPATTPQRGLRVAAAAVRGVRRTALADELAFAARARAWYALRPFPGYTGEPALATANAGARLAGIIVDGFAAAAADVFANRAAPPAPTFTWLAAATLGGRLPA